MWVRHSYGVNCITSLHGGALYVLIDTLTLPPYIPYNNGRVHVHMYVHIMRCVVAWFSAQLRL